MRGSTDCCWGRAGSGGCRSWLIAAMLLIVLRPAVPENVRLLCLNGLKHDYDLPNGLAAKVAAARVNDDPLILPNDRLDLQLIDTTLVRTTATMSGVNEPDFTTLKITFFDSILSAAEGTLPAQAGTNTTCTASRIAAAVGPLYSSESVLLKTVLQKDSRDLLTISYGATSPTLSDSVQYPYFGRTVPSDFKQGTGIFDLIKHLDINLVKLWGCSDVYCQGLVDVFIQSANSHKIQIDTEHSNFDFGRGFKAVHDIVEGIAQNCTAPRTQVLMVQRPNAESIFLAAKQLGVESSFIFVGPVSVSGIATLPTGYLGFKTGVDAEATEFAKLQSGWTTELGDGRYPILAGPARDVSSHPYVGYAYDAVLAIAQALHVMRLNGEDTYNTTIFKSRLKTVTFRGSSGEIRFDQNLEPANGRYLIVNKKQSSLEGIGVWAAGTISYHDSSGQTMSGQTQAQWERSLEWPSSSGKYPTVECRLDCDPGEIFSSQTAQCEECPAGTYQSKETCVACAVGTHAPVQGMARCLPCSSGYANSTGQVTCTRCPTNSETDLGATGTSVEECICHLDMYRLTPGSPCIPCEQGASCVRGNIFVRGDFWRGSDIECVKSNIGSQHCPPGIELRAAVYPCRPQYCKQKNSTRPEPDTECREGHEGVACGVCKQGWANQKGFCVFCDTPQDQSVAGRRGAILVKYVLPSFVGLLAAVVYYVFAWRPIFTNTPGLNWEAGASSILTRLGCVAVGGGAAAASESAGTSANQNPLSQLMSGNSIAKLKKGFDTAMKAKEKVANMSGVGPVFKVLAGFYQVTSSFIESFDVRWPDAMLAVSQVASFCQFDVMTLPGTACSMRRWSYFEMLLAQTLTPPIVLTALALPSMLIAVVGLTRCGGVWKHPAAEPTYERFFQSMVVFLFIIYPSVSRGVFTSFNTVDFSTDGRYLKFDHSVSIDGPEYKDKIFLWSLVCVFLYPLGIPLFLISCMYIARIPHLVKKKLEQARFIGLLNLRTRQLNSMTRELCVFAIGNSIHDNEFRRRVKVIFDSSLSNLFCTDKETGEQVLSHFNLRKAIAYLGEVDIKNVPRGDVHDLLELYDTNLNGLDFHEFTNMLQDLVDTRTLLTAFESIETLNKVQLLALRAHDWDLPVYDIFRQRDDDHSEFLNEEDLQEFEKALEVKEKAERQRLKSIASLTKQKSKKALKKGEWTSSNPDSESQEVENYLPIRDRIAKLAQENMTEKELVHWVQFQAEKLDREGKLLIEPRTWAPTSSDTEKKAIQYLGFLFIAYRVETWWFEVVIMFHKLFMTSVLAFICKGSPTQMGIGFMVTFTMLMIFSSYRPVENPVLLRLQIFAFTVQLLNLFLGIMLQTNAFKDLTGDGNGDSGTTLSIVWLNVAVLVLPALQIMLDLVAARLRVMHLARKLNADKKDLDTQATSQENPVTADGLNKNRRGTLKSLGSVHHMDYYGLDPEIFLKNPGAANDDALHAKDIKPADQPKDIKLADQLASNPALFPATSTSTGILHSPSSSALDSIVRKPGATATASLLVVPPGLEGYRRVEPVEGFSVVDSSEVSSGRSFSRNPFAPRFSR